jgi:hypothetical protein
MKLICIYLYQIQIVTFQSCIEEHMVHY